MVSGTSVSLETDDPQPFGACVGQHESRYKVIRSEGGPAVLTQCLSSSAGTAELVLANVVLDK